MTTGALVPSSNGQVCDCVNGPKILSSPALTVRERVIVALPPQHASGNALPGSCGTSGAKVARTRRLLTWVTSFNGIASSGTPSPFVSQFTTTEVGANPQPMMSRVTAQNAFTIPTVDRGSTGGWPAATTTVPSVMIVGQVIGGVDSPGVPADREAAELGSAEVENAEVDTVGAGTAEV